MKSASTPDGPLPPRVPNRFVLVLRSFCVGIATMVVAGYLSALIAVAVATHSTPGVHINSTDSGVEVGWDLVTFVHVRPSYWLLLPAAAFAAGSIFGLRYFSRERR